MVTPMVTFHFSLAYCGQMGQQAVQICQYIESSCLYKMLFDDMSHNCIVNCQILVSTFGKKNPVSLKEIQETPLFFLTAIVFHFTCYIFIHNFTSMAGVTLQYCFFFIEKFKQDRLICFMLVPFMLSADFLFILLPSDYTLETLMRPS